MPRTSVALFLSTLALAGATSACSRSPEAGEHGGDKDKDRQEMTQPASPNPATKEDNGGGEGGEGGEG